MKSGGTFAVFTPIYIQKLMPAALNPAMNYLPRWINLQIMHDLDHGALDLGVK